MMMSEQLYEQRIKKEKYAFDVRPAKAVKHRISEAASAKDRKRVLATIVVCAMICLGLIVSAAYGAAINYSNNQMKNENKALSGEVDSLKVEIQSANNVASIEKKAKSKLGMVYPKGKHYVVVTGKEKPDSDFASLLREEAFD